MDKNVIFIYPLNDVLNQLKSELEKDESFSVLEVDMLDEYRPLVSNVESSITFSSDIRKTIQFLEDCKRFLTSKAHHNILVTKKLPSGIEQSKMEKNGLNETLPDYTQIKSLFLKINRFFKNTAIVETKELISHSNPLDNIDAQDVQWIERLTAEEKLIKEREKLKQNRPLNTDGDSEEMNPDLMEALYTDEISPATKQFNSTMSLTEAIDLPEIIFFPPLSILDPIAFFMEILLNNNERQFKLKYIKMCLLKVYGAQFYVADQAGWEEDAPDLVKALNILDYNGPHWINEARGSEENILIMPIMANEVITSGMSLVVPGKISHEKMGEMEFWCYLSRSICT